MSVMTVSHSVPRSRSLPLGHAVDGVLSIRKPAGWTSHDVVAHLRRVSGIRKIGHAGTLDPSATGVLPVLLGKGTKIAQYLLDWEKEYLAVLRLGEKTDTQDATGSVVWRSSATVTEPQIRSVVSEFRGTIDQLPPMYSAVKVGGEPLYKAARKGWHVERASRTVTIYELDVLDVHGMDVELRIVCSKGTYVRTLCEDIGDRLRVGGHLLRLVRTRVGPCTLETSVDAEAITSRQIFEEQHAAWWSVDSALARFPELVVTEPGERKIRHGAEISLSLIHADFRAMAHQLQRGQLVRLKNTHARLLALGRMQDEFGPGEERGISMVRVL